MQQKNVILFQKIQENNFTYLFHGFIVI